VRILSPTNGTVFPAYATVRIEVQPEFTPGENSVKYGVEPDRYYPEGYLIAEVKSPPYSLTLSNVPAGEHRYVVWTGDVNSPRSALEILVTNPPVHAGPFWLVKVMGDSSAVGINNHGAIVANSGDHAYTWMNGKIREVAMPEGDKGNATAINDAGDITGFYINSEGERKAFIYRSGVSRAIEIPRVGYSEGRKLSPRGDVTGVYSSAGTELSFLYTAEGVLLTNEPPLASDAYWRWPVSVSINSYGMVAGTTNGTFEPNAFLRGVGPDGIEHRLPSMWRSRAEGINDGAQVLMRGRRVGGLDFMDDYALLYSHFQVQEWSGFYGENRPHALNKWGQAVGETAETLYGRHGAFEGYGKTRVVFWSDGKSRDLNSLVEANGWVLWDAVGINDHGQIVGTATVDGMRSGYLLNPRPKVLNVEAKDGGIRLSVHDRPGTSLKVQSSSDLATWVTVVTNTADVGIREVSLPTEGDGFRFFRVMDDEVIPASEQ
jgi:hypothetical protein